MNGSVDTIIKDGIASITFFHPQSNSLPGELLRKIAAEINAAGKNKDARVIILKSEGEKAFCAGASFDELVAIKSLEEGRIFFSGFASVINAMRKAPKFILARIHGKAVGGGLGLACAADHAFALNTAAVKLSELAVGIGPFVVGPAVERKTGTSAFVQLSLDASNWKSAAWAMEKGIYASVFDSVVELDNALMKLATTLSTSSPEAMKELKKISWEGTENWDKLLLERAEISGRLVLSDFTRSAIEKFKSGVR